MLISPPGASMVKRCPATIRMPIQTSFRGRVVISVDLEILAEDIHNDDFPMIPGTHRR